MVRWVRWVFFNLLFNPFFPNHHQLLYLLYFPGWRRSHRPSLHDISIIDEEEEREDIEGIADEDTAANTLSNAQTATAFTITK